MNVEKFGRQAWWLLLIQGIAGLVVGVMFLRMPSASMLAWTVVLGGYAVVRGILGIIDVGIGPRETLGWRLFASMVSLVAGAFVLSNPLTSAGLLPVAYVIVLAVDALITGAVYVYSAVKGAGPGATVLGILELLVGVLLLATPFQAAVAVPYMLGVLFIIGGLAVVGTCAWLKMHEREIRQAVTA